MLVDELQKTLDIYPPFLFIDEAISVIPGKESISIFTVNKDHWFFDAHLKSSPTMPGVLLAENMLQTSMLAIYTARDPDEEKGFVHQFSVTLRNAITIQDSPIKLKTIAVIDSAKRGVTKLSCQINHFDSNKIIADSHITHFIPSNLHP